MSQDDRHGVLCHACMNATCNHDHQLIKACHDIVTTLNQYDTCVVCRIDTYLCIATSPPADDADFLTATCVSLRFDLDLDTTQNLRDPLGLESLWVNRNLEKNGGFETLWVILPR